MKWSLVSVSCALLLTWAVGMVEGNMWEHFRAKRAVSSVGSTAWCYHLSTCDYKTWPTISPDYCNGTRQSPINIITAKATVDANLDGFTFNNYSSTSSMTTATNTGNTFKVGLSGVSISGGDLGESYDSLQFHLHWGNGSSTGGSEHTVDGKQYPMELHIVNAKSSYKGDTTKAVKDPAGLAALGFFIEAAPGNAGPASWKTLTSYLANITQKDQSVDIAAGVSLDHLLSGVDRTKYYRYNGSLTTPSCNEAVVWTVFKDTIKVSSDLIDLFSTTLHIGNSSSELMYNTFRGVQADQPVTMTSSGSSTTCFSLVLMALCLLIGNV